MEKLYDNKKYRPRKNPHAFQGVISLILAAISWSGTAVLCLKAFGEGGNIGAYGGSIGLFLLVLAAAGFVYGIKGLREEDRRHVMAVFGLVLNLLLLAGLAGIFLIGMI